MIYDSGFYLTAGSYSLTLLCSVPRTLKRLSLCAILEPSTLRINVNENFSNHCCRALTAGSHGCSGSHGCLGFFLTAGSHFTTFLSFQPSHGLDLYLTVGVSETKSLCFLAFLRHMLQHEKMHPLWQVDYSTIQYQRPREGDSVDHKLGLAA